MKINYFFRHSSSFYSIEEQFLAVQNHIPEDLRVKNVYARYESKGFFKRLAISLQAAFRQGDINHITGDIHFVALFLKKHKTVLTVHDIGSVIHKTGMKGKILRFFWFKMPFARVRYITVISEFTKSEILRNFKVDPSKIVVVPNCVSDRFFPGNNTLRNEKPVILQLGTTQNKNLHNLCAALDKVSCKLHIVGRLSDEQTLLLKTSGVDYENAYNLKQSEIVSLYQKCDLVSFVSTYEGFGVPILEAQATGKPVITSNISPMKEVAGAGAMLVDPHNVDDIRTGILKILNDKEFRDKIINAGFENVKNYSAKSVADAYLKLYKEMLKN
jgi:glycosyltransferase involved in cell wall biosynthesis